MSENSPRRASLIGILAIFALFALFVAVVYYVYVPRSTGAFPDDGIRTAAQRKENLAKLRAHEKDVASGYGWVDPKTGVVQLPIDRAMELTLQKYAKQ